MDEVRDAYKLGLSVTAVLCATCEDRQQCLHMQLKDRAEASQHTVSTMARMRHRQLSRGAAGREFVRIDENCIDLLRPCVKVRLPVLRLVLLAVKHSHDFASQNSDPDIQATRDFLEVVLLCGKQVTTAFENATSHVALHPAQTAAKPKLADFVLMKGLRRSGIDGKKMVIADAMHLLIGFACGELVSCRLQVTRGKKDDKETALVGVWETQLPLDGNGRLTSSVILADATANAEMLSRIIAHPVNDITPQGSIRYEKRVVQIPLDIKRGTKVEVFLKTVRGILVANPSKTRVGPSSVTATTCRTCRGWATCSANELSRAPILVQVTTGPRMNGRNLVSICY